MAKKRIRLAYQKERALLSDMLPYELPITVSNRHLYKFILENLVHFSGTEIRWKKRDAALDEIVHLLFSLPKEPKRLSDSTILLGSKPITVKVYKCGGKPSKYGAEVPRFLRPYGFKIAHKENEFRELSIPHPRSQMKVVEFYDDWKELILYYCSQSEFSIRYPARVASSKYVKDRTHYEKLGSEEDLVEQDGREYENLRSFFSYATISNVHKFYESPQYHRCEKKYDRLYKMDISKCFDSIYTHTITWAIYGKERVQQNIPLSNNTFPGKFDKLMQTMNRGETNGILIGSEFSRIFAEVILQHIDREVQNRLSQPDKSLTHKVDYEVFRYVDDYFIFANSDEAEQKIVTEFQHALKEFKMHLNPAKAQRFSKPIITNITMAKDQIARLIESRVHLDAEEKIDPETGEVLTFGKIHVSGGKLITDFKAILRTTQVRYSDILNYTLAVVERKCRSVFKKFGKVEKTDQLREQIVLATGQILEFVFFIFSVEPKVNFTVRACRIFNIVKRFLSGFSEEHQNNVSKLIYDEIIMILKRSRSNEHVQVEELYLLVTLVELGKDFWLEESLLRRFLGLSDTALATGANKALSHFMLTVALFYMRNKTKYEGLRLELEQISLNRILDANETRFLDGELIMLLFDLCTCPYIAEDTKKAALKAFGVVDAKLASDIINFKDSRGKKQLWFTSWVDFNYSKALDAKQSQEVY
ncbi:MAG: RNA-directed DNA polymerase [Alphaproteobacteria bacterium]|nr:RNA-directed DNA polymerase [Alphaproteobacteria bacterium]